MIAVLTPEQMRAADAAAIRTLGRGRESVLVDRAGYAVARTARRMLGGAYGRRVLIIAGHGHNGDDGRVAGSWLSEWGAHVRTVSPDDCDGMFVDSRTSDLVIDAAYGIGFRGSWIPPVVFDVPVLAVDLPSGLNGVDGSVAGGVVAAHRTVTFAAPKVGMLVGQGPQVCGVIEVADLGIDVDVAEPDVYLVDALDVTAWVPPRDVEAHKWTGALRVVAGSAGMGGAAALVSAAAMRAGAGIVHLSWRGGADTLGASVPTEVVGRHLPDQRWAEFVVSDSARFDALVIGPGLGRGDDVAAEVRAVLSTVELPAVVDGDGLPDVVDPAGTHATLRARTAPTVLTPHDGEFAILGGDAHDPDRVAATRELARQCGCTVLRKGPTTIIADPEGACYLVATGDERLATAGSGDVLAGIIGAFLTRGVPAPEAAAAGAFVHGYAGSTCPREGTIARDVVSRIGDVMEELIPHVG